MSEPSAAAVRATVERGDSNKIMAARLRSVEANYAASIYERRAQREDAKATRERSA